MTGELRQLVSADTYPYLLEQLTGNVGGPDCSYADEFDFGLDLILDTLETRLAAARC